MSAELQMHLQHHARGSTGNNYEQLLGSSSHYESQYGRKTVGATEQGNDFIQPSSPMRNSMRNYNQIVMKSYEQMLPKFSNEPGLHYIDRFEFCNNSTYRGQIMKIDE